MKTLKALVMVATLGLVAVGCAKTDKILIKKEGLWNMTSLTTREYTNDVLDTTYTEADGGTMEFREDGTGTEDPTDGPASEFTWTFNEDTETISLCVDFGGISICFPYEVVESKSKHQEWFGVLEDDSTRVEQDIVLDRAE